MAQEKALSSLSSQPGPPLEAGLPWEPLRRTRELLGSEVETMLGQGKRKCSPPKACSVMLRHRDSRVGLISRSGPGTRQSEWERGRQ